MLLQEPSLSGVSLSGDQFFDRVALGTIHILRKQIFTFFDPPYPLRKFILVSVLKISKNGPPLPTNAYVICEWSLGKHLDVVCFRRSRLLQLFGFGKDQVRLLACFSSCIKRFFHSRLSWVRTLYILTSTTNSCQLFAVKILKPKKQLPKYIKFQMVAIQCGVFNYNTPLGNRM